MQRDGLRANEQMDLVRNTQRAIEEGQDEDAAYALACRSVVSVSPKTFAAWKDHVLARVRGEIPTELPAKPEPPGTTVYKKLEEASAEISRLQNIAAERASEIEKLKEQVKSLREKNAELEKAFLEEPKETVKKK